MTITELTQKIEYRASKTKLLYWLLLQYYRDVIKKEITLADITSDDHILCIGGGNCPFSAILFHRATGAKVTVIDNISDCAAKAREVISRLGLDGYVRVFNEDGCSADLGGYTVVHFAMQVAPMDTVFAAVEKSAAPGTKLLIRRPKKCLSKLYSRLIPAYERYIAHKKARNIGVTMMYVKQF